MQAESQSHDVLRDPVLDGRDSLSLVKLRLGLTLIAVAILPIAALSPLVRAIAEDARVAHQEHLAGHASLAAADVRREIARVESVVDGVLADAAVASAAAPDADAATRRKASNRLAQLLAQSGGAIIGLGLLTTGGSRAAAGEPIDVAAPLPGLLVGGVTVDRTGSLPRIVVVEASPAGAKPPRTVVAAVSVAELLAGATPPVAVPGRDLAIVDGSGALLAEAVGSLRPGALPGQALDLATTGAHDSDGRAALGQPGLEGWHVVASAPLPLVALPLPALAAVAGLLLLLVAFTAWMARQILRPARQLEASRSRLRELYESAREAALRDSLTGLGNHRSFQETVARMVEGAGRYGTPFALVLIDVDEFKRINDTRGHAVGDQLLAEVGELIGSTMRASDAAFRVGGDEFAILLPHTEVYGALVAARRLLALGLGERARGRYPEPISFSAGVTACPEFGATRLELTAQADAALYRGKRTGRTVVTVYDPDEDRGHVDESMRAELSSAISAVIEAGTLRAVYQPIVELSSGRVVGYEGLVRVPRESTFAHAGALFDAAEVAGRVHELDRAALDKVLRGAVMLREGMTLSVNVSPRTLEAPEFGAATFLAMIRRHGMSPGRIVLELTERESIRDPERVRAVLAGVQAAGVRVAADDVGAGNSGLRLLSQLRFDVVKIDLSLVQHAADNRTHSVLRSIVEVAARMGATTIAEGVETSAQLRMTRELGITAGQGYLLGRPGPEHDIEWVDIAALERRDDIPNGIDARPVSVPAPRRQVAYPVPGPSAAAGAEPAGGAVAGVRRRSMTFLRPTHQTPE